MYTCNGSICTYVCNGYICTNIHMLSRNTFKFSLYIFLASSNNCNVSLKKHKPFRKSYKTESSVPEADTILLAYTALFKCNFLLRLHKILSGN
jgi:hypothetical protein